MVRLLSLCVATLGVLSSTVSVSAGTASTQCVQQYEAPQIRYPPAAVLESPPPSSSSTPPPEQSTSTAPTQSHSIDDTHPHPSAFPETSNQTWQPPPANILWSPWHMTHTTRPSYLALTNMQSTHYPLFPQSPSFPPGSQIDLVSWSTSATNLSDPRVTTVFGYFAPVAFPAVAVWRYTSTGVLANVTNLWAILGWGVDEDGWEYRVDYETGYQVAGTDESETGAACVNVASRRQGGPSGRTYREIVAGLVGVGERNGDAGFVALVGNLTALRYDARREEAVEVDCDQACVDNADLDE